MRAIRVLIVDDAVVIRRLLSEALRAEGGIEVSGTAANGRIGLAKIAQTSPDLVILDINMPEMDGLQALAVIRRQYPSLPVIMFSTLTAPGAAKTVAALALGASDYVAKPAGLANGALTMQQVRTELIPKIMALCTRSVDGAAPELDPRIPSRPAAGRWTLLPSPAHPAWVPASNAFPGGAVPSRAASRIDLVAIGVSTGGPNALVEIFRRLPRDLPAPIVITQHMPAQFTGILAQRLAEGSGFLVREGTPGIVLKPSEAWIAPGGFHMTVVRSGRDLILQTNTDPPENSCRPAVDVMFRSVAQVAAEHTLGVILTGMGQDGLRGCSELCSKGGRVIVQDEQSSVVWGMPGFVARASLAEKVLPLNEIAGEIVRQVVGGRNRAPVAAAKIEESVNA